MNDREVLLILLAAVSLWGAWLAVRLLAGVLQLCRMRFGPGAVEPAVRSRMPAEIAAILDPLGERLASLGFAHESTFLVRSALRSGDPEPIWLDVHVHAASASRALVQLSETPEPGQLAAISFHTACGARQLRTENRRRHLHFPFPPAWELADAEAPGLEAHWQFHLQRLPGGASCDLPAQEVRLLSGEFFDFWEASGFMHRLGAEWRLSRRGAWQYLRQVMAGNRRMARLPPLGEVEPAASRQFADVRAWEFQERLLSANGMSRRGKLAWFAASAAAGLLAFIWMDSLRTALLIFAILLFHEFGHALAMRAFGYRNLGVLVLPFLGAVALGRKDDAGPWQKLVMLLAGPVPGLVIGALCLRYGMAPGSSNGWLSEAGILMLSINLFNLLPFTPLDGGQIVETFLFARRPRLRLAFFALSTLALMLLGYWLQSSVLAGVGLLLALGIPAAWRRVALLRGLAPGGSGEAAAGAILARLHAMPGPRWPVFAQRMLMVRSLLPALRGRMPTLTESISGTAIYLAAIALPLALLWGTVVPHRVADWTLRQVASATTAPPDWDRQLAAARTPEERWQVLYDAGRWLADSEQEALAGERFRAALLELDKLPDDAHNHLRRLDTRIALAHLAEDGAAAAYEDLLPVLRALPEGERWRLADVLEASSWQVYDQPEREIPYLREAIAVREAEAGRTEAGMRALHGDRVRLARLLDAAGAPTAAEALLRQSLRDTLGLYPVQLESMAWFFLAHAQPVEAELVLRRAAEMPGAGKSGERVLAWAYLAQGRQDEALALLSGLLADGEKAPRNEWGRLQTLLDLVHASAGRPEDEARWLALADESAQRLGGRLAAFRQRVYREAENGSWESLRGKARQAVLGRLPEGPAAGGDFRR